ncbi:MAG TPA: helix-turn-helix transcriptional regulator [Plantibacter sp.]|uniref:helix-turn-helix domain-containing protein n=1 Tax=unclassified Plantibacter TaxID=2624265 RepID=UPI002B9C544E|nr:helix-turn-helix transcriptional regulator [Plantibacter sp.]
MTAGSIALGAFLRARRDVCQPEDVGIISDAARRVAGLRRDELAQLAGISAEYYVRLEQGRGGRPSDQVLTAIARALRLDADAKRYLFRLASGETHDRAQPAAESAERIARVLAHLTHTPAYISDSNRDIVASNPLASAFGHGGLATGSNVVTDLFNEHMKVGLEDWEEMTRSTVAGLRRDADPRSPRLAELIEELSADPDFVRIWARYDVSGPEDARIRMLVDGVGAIDIEVQNLAVRSMPGHVLTVLSAPAQSVTAAVFAGLAASLDAPDPAGVGT